MDNDVEPGEVEVTETVVAETVDPHAGMEARVARLEALLNEDLIDCLMVLSEAVAEIRARDNEPQVNHPMYRKLWGEH